MPELIFITGVSGYIGFQTLVLALEAGYLVRAAVRKSAQISKLSRHTRVQPHIAQLTFVVIPDLTNIDILVQNLKGVWGILHLASPLAIETDDYERDIIQPALSLTTALLSAAALTPTIRRLIVTSSAVTLVPFSWLSAPDTKTLHTAASINTCTTGPYTSPMSAYWSSKALSRKAVHEFIAHHTPNFEIIQLLPSVVIGPDMLASTPDDVLTNTRALALAPIIGQIITTPLVGVTVHVLDVARAHVDALSARVPGNRDYILSSDTPDGIVWNDALEIAQKYFPGEIEKGVLKMDGSMQTTKWRIGTEGTEEAFGWRCRSFEETMRDLIGSYVELFGKKAAAET